MYRANCGLTWSQLDDVVVREWRMYKADIDDLMALDLDIIEDFLEGYDELK